MTTSPWAGTLRLTTYSDMSGINYQKRRHKSPPGIVSRSLCILFRYAVFLILCLMTAGQVLAVEKIFWIKPDQCVSNFKGQDCTKRITLHWRLDEPLEYCLYRSSEREALVCWSHKAVQKHTLVFKSSKNEIFQVIRQDNGQIVAEAEFSVAWVYRSGKNSFLGWRVF